MSWRYRLAMAPSKTSKSPAKRKAITDNGDVYDFEEAKDQNQSANGSATIDEARFVYVKSWSYWNVLLEAGSKMVISGRIRSGERSITWSRKRGKAQSTTGSWRLMYCCRKRIPRRNPSTGFSRGPTITSLNWRTQTKSSWAGTSKRQRVSVLWSHEFLDERIDHNGDR